MWCSNCQQDVPAVATSAVGEVQCARCQQELYPANKAEINNEPTISAAVNAGGVSLEADPSKKETPEPSAHEPKFRVDPWHTSVLRSHEINTLLESPFYDQSDSGPQGSPPLGSQTSLEMANPHLRFDPPEDLWSAEALEVESSFGPLSNHTSETIARRRIVRPSAKESGSALGGWLLTLLGITGLGAGLGLLIRATYGNRPDFWNYGIVTTFTSQVVLILGLILIVSRLWRSVHQTTKKLNTLHQKLDKVQQTAETLSTLRTSSAQQFYADIARGASPQMMLTDLKGQIEKISKQIFGER